MADRETIAELERELAVTEHRRDRAVEQKEDAERVAEDARNDRDDARDRLEVAEAQVATLTRERDEARAALEACRETCMEAEGYRDRAETAERERDRLRGALEEADQWILDRAKHLEKKALPWPKLFDHACKECIDDANTKVQSEGFHYSADMVRPGFRCAVHAARARAALAPQAEKEDGK